jgi:hypothetical protein
MICKMQIIGERLEELEKHIEYMIISNAGPLKEVFLAQLGQPSGADWSIPKPPPLSQRLLIPKKLQMIRNIEDLIAESYIQKIGYNFLGDPFWVVKKSFPMNKLSKMAQEMTTSALPIKCLEAVVLAMCLSAGLHLDRIRKIST